MNELMHSASLIFTRTFRSLLVIITRVVRYVYRRRIVQVQSTLIETGGDALLILCIFVHLCMCMSRRFKLKLAVYFRQPSIHPSSEYKQVLFSIYSRVQAERVHISLQNPITNSLQFCLHLINTVSIELPIIDISWRHTETQRV